jgi:hypothetical protein
MTPGAFCLEERLRFVRIGCEDYPRMRALEV